jgi:two-component system, response regulator YesN
MRLKHHGDNGKLFIRLLLSITLCIVVTLVVSSAILFTLFNRIALKQVYQSDLAALNQTSKEVVGMTDSAQSLTFQLYRSLNVSKLMFYAKPNVYDTVAAMRELDNYLSSMPFIESIYVYNPHSHYVYLSSNSEQNGLFAPSELADQDILKMLDNYQDYKPFTPIPRTIPVADSTERQAVYTYLCYDAIGQTDKVNSAIIVNINAQWINRDIGSHGAQAQNGKSFIIDNRGRLLSGDNLLADGTGDEAKELIQRIVADENSGYFIGQSSGEKSLVSYTKPDSLEWRYVRITPYRDVTRQVNSIHVLTITVAAAILAAGLIASFLLSRRLFMPIDRMASRMRTLETEKRNSLLTLRQDLLRNLVLGREALNPRSLRRRMDDLGIEFEFQNEYRMALLAIDRFQSFLDTSGSDARVYKYAIMNICYELASQSYKVETVDMDADGVLLLLGSSQAAPFNDQALLESVLRHIQQAVLEHLRIGLTIAYTDVDSHAVHVHTMYKKVKEASLHRLFTGHRSLIRAGEVIMPTVKEYVYPVDKEKRLIESVAAGKADEAMQLIDCMVHETRSHSIQVARWLLSHLAMVLTNVLHSLQRSHAIVFERSPEHMLVISEQSFETLQEAESIFQALLEEVRDKLAEKRSMRHEDLIKHIHQMIEEHYGDSNLSLNWIADKLDLSPSYVGRIYKQITLNALIDVINSVRMERSIELLEGTHYSVAEIAERIGYTNPSYFYRMFKKHYGVTPTDYRRRIAGNEGKVAKG